MHLVLLTMLGAPTPDAGLISTTPDLRSLSRGSEAVSFDPAGAVFADGFEIHGRARLLPNEDGPGRFGVYAAAPVGPVGFFGGYEWFRIDQNRHRRATFGLGGRLGRRVGFGLSWHRYDATRLQHLDDVSTWDFSLFSEPFSWMSVAAGVESLNSPRFGDIKQHPRYELGLSVRPWLGADWLTIGADARLDSPDGEDADYGLGRVRAVLDVAPVEGLHALVGYTHTRNDDALWVGLSVALGGLELQSSVLTVNEAGDSAFSDIGVAATFRTNPSENFLQPTGRIVEMELAGSLEDAGTGLFSLNKRSISTAALQLDRLAENDTVGTVYLNIGKLEIGLATVEELRAAIKRVRAAGKQVVAEVSSADDKAYVVAAAADKIRMDPVSSLQIDGFALTVRYFADGLDKIGVKLESVEIGTYKSGPDPLTRNRPRPEDREVRQEVLDRAQRTLMAALAEDRQLPADKINEILATGFFPGPDALSMGLVDELTSPASADAAPTFRYRGETPDAVRSPSRRWSQAPIIAVIPVVGTIVSSEGGNPLPGDSASADALVGQLEAARSDGDVKAVVLRVNSPGGDVTASDVVWRAVRKVQEHKPVVVSMGDVAASGGYYVSASADAIFAEPNTITGSIGIFALKANLVGLYDWLGIYNEVYKTGENADWDSTTHDLRESDRERLRKNLRYYYDGFVARVAAGRGMTTEQVEAVAQGRVFTGERAKEVGLVDAVGGLSEAIRDAQSRAGLDPDEEIAITVPTRGLSVGGVLRSLVGLQEPNVLSLMGDLNRRVEMLDGTPMYLLPQDFRIDP